MELLLEAKAVSVKGKKYYSLYLPKKNATSLNLQAGDKLLVELKEIRRTESKTIILNQQNLKELAETLNK